MQTSIRVDAELRDELADLAASDFGGSTLAEALAALIKEHRRATLVREMRESYARLQADPEGWADYLRESREWDEASAGEVPE